jgi:hypothetical protein
MSTDLDKMMNKLAKKASKKQPAKSTEQKTRLVLSDEGQAVFQNFVKAKALNEITSKEEAQQKSLLNEITLETWTQKLWEDNALPTTTEILSHNSDNTVDMSLTLSITTKFNIQSKEEDPKNSVVELLRTAGLSAAKSKKIVNEELDFTPTLGIRTFNDLASGTDEEKACAVKMMAFFTGEKTEAPTDEEQAMILVNSNKITVKAGFLNRVCTYVKSLDELRMVFKVIKPGVTNKSAKFGKNDSEMARAKRLSAEATDLLESVCEEESE